MIWKSTYKEPPRVNTVVSIWDYESDALGCAILIDSHDVLFNRVADCGDGWYLAEISHCNNGNEILDIIEKMDKPPKYWTDEIKPPPC
jgi:hypothetical protein